MAGREYIVDHADPRTVTYVGTCRFIYALYFDSHLPWVYGGEYVDFSRYVRSVVEAWIRVSLKVYFVFDGESILKSKIYLISANLKVHTHR